MTEKKKPEQEFVPKVIEDDSDDKPRFLAFVPSQIKANDNYDQRLLGFPLNILFGGITLDRQTGRESLVHVCYEPSPETYRENSKRKEMRYFTTPTNGFSVRVIFDKETGRWRSEKFRGPKLIRMAQGSTFEQVMIHTTMDRPEPDERFSLERKPVK